MIADTLQDLQCLEKLLSASLDQGDMGNSEVHHKLLKALVELRKKLVLVPELWNPVS